MAIAQQEPAVGKKVKSDKKTATLIVLRGPGQTTAGGLTVGMADVTAAGRTVTLDQPELAAYIPRPGAPPIGPFRISAGGLSQVQDLLSPSVIYTPAVLAALATGGVHAVAHITGGGIPGNVPRVLNDGVDAVIDRSTWTVPPVFGELARLGDVDDDEMLRVFNMGLGMVVAVAPDAVSAVNAALASMPEYQRAMIIMYHAEDMSYEEMAAALDLPVGTVKSRLNRARIGLRDLLLKHEELFRR